MNELILKIKIFLNSLNNNESKNRLFEYIWKKFHKKLSYYVYRNFHFNLFETDEIVQEIMIKIFNNIERFNPEYSFNTWIYSITRNYCKDLLKRKCTEINQDINEFPDVTHECYGLLEKKDTKCIVRRYLEGLDTTDREMLYLRYYESMSLSIISDILGIPEGTVKSRLFYLKKKMAKDLKDMI